MGRKNVKVLFFVAVCLALLFYVFSTQDTENAGDIIKVVVGVLGAGLGVTISIFGIGKKRKQLGMSKNLSVPLKYSNQALRAELVLLCP